MSMDVNVGFIAGVGSCAPSTYEVCDNDDQKKIIYSRVRKLVENSGKDSLHELVELVKANKEKISEPYRDLIGSIIVVGEVLYKQIPQGFSRSDLQTTFLTLQFLLLKELPENY
jgi:hypothetical protein